MYTTGQIGTTAPSYKLHINGTIAGTSYVTTSDRHFKQDIEPPENAPQTIQCLQGLTDRWIDPEMSPDLQIGLIAQDVEACIPELVETDSSGYKSVAYDRLVVPLIENAHQQDQLNKAHQQALRTQTAINLAQQQTIKDLEARLARVESLLQK